MNTKLAELSRSAAEGLQSQVSRASGHTRHLMDAVERSAGHARHLAVDAARHAEQAVSRRVRRIHARVVLLEVKAKVTLASRVAEDRDFEGADHRLAEATELLAEARLILADDEVISADWDNRDRCPRCGRHLGTIGVHRACSMTSAATTAPRAHAARGGTPPRPLHSSPVWAPSSCSSAACSAPPAR